MSLLERKVKAAHIQPFQGHGKGWRGSSLWMLKAMGSFTVLGDETVCFAQLAAKVY